MGDHHDSAGHERVVAIVRGRVHGVGFRYFVVRSATKTSLTGWVRNEPDGSVCVTAEGTRHDIDSLVEDLKRGPRASSVESVETRLEPARNEFETFEMRRR